MTTVAEPKGREYLAHLKRPHAKQRAFMESQAKRRVIRAGRRGGKTTGMAIMAVQEFLKGRRILYATPTSEQIDRFWHEVCMALEEPIDAGVYYKNETRHVVELVGTEQRIRAKTAWNADSLRGDYADLLILDEWQLMDEEAWEVVGAPMLLDNNGDAVFIYTPPSMHSRSVSKARDPRHASKLYKRADADTSGRWAAFHFPSRENPYISVEALEELAVDMTQLAYRQEIDAEDVDEAPGALWTRQLLEDTRRDIAPDLARLVVGVDPPGGATECGIVAVGLGPCDCRGKAETHLFVIQDESLQASPDTWASAVIRVYQGRRADRVIGEKNYGGDMVENTIRNVAKGNGVNVSYKNVIASRGKAVRAEPIAALFEQGMMHLVGSFPHLEDEMCSWTPGDTKWSPNRLDAMVWAATELSPRRSWRPM